MVSIVRPVAVREKCGQNQMCAMERLISPFMLAYILEPPALPWPNSTHKFTRFYPGFNRKKAGAEAGGGGAKIARGILSSAHSYHGRDEEQPTDHLNLRIYLVPLLTVSSVSLFLALMLVWALSCYAAS